MVRIAYFGTDGCPGHHVIPIRGKFTEEDIKVIESVDCDDFYKVFDVMRFKIAEFKGWTILGIPASLDDHRPGSKTVIFIEGEANEADFIEVTQEYSFLKNKVKKLAELYHDGEWLATGKLNQDSLTNKERFQFTLDKGDIINMIRGVDLDPYSDVANEMEKIGLGSSSDSSVMGIMKWRLYEELKSRYDRVFMTFGYITKHNRIKYGIEKSHTSDAFVISKNINAKRIERQYLKRLIRRHNRQIHKMKILKGGKKKNNQAPFEVFGFRLFDKVLYNNKICLLYTSDAADE